MSLSPTLTLLAADLAAVLVLVLGLYHPRHHRRDLVVAYLGINIGVFTVSATLASSAVGAGLGLGLLGVLSIIRLRSDELSQREVAYYFASLAIGLLGGLAPSPVWLAAAGMALVVGVMYLADHPRLLPTSRSQTIVLDRAIPDESELRLHLAALLHADVRAVTVQRLDLVNDSTWVEVRYRLRPGAPAAPDGPNLTSAVAPLARTTVHSPATPATPAAPTALDALHAADTRHPARGMTVP
ncbi:DUF4956 domain-containing protein [Litorihabitans aurantiacus]|uniref:DUF4956 domain-containing protein n=1 Tax=Litorihabitans aurantiacus TaxID=1930061 RepID=A0AA37XI30_9MICO|nr:DUF4956 domain-containing protein [Litorihabitans aurantiacus]GMA33427.1 hypothetical protein GCM10025875_34190 [Litorihabitans aurantiacus]